MLHRKLFQYYSEERPVWVFLRDQQRWIEEAMVVEIQADLVTLRYDDEDDDERIPGKKASGSIRLGR